MGALQVMQQVGRQWQSLKDKSYFQDKANRDKIRYLHQMREFYDEVERIGDRVGTQKTEDGMYSVATTNVGKPKKIAEVKEQ